jgi:hypothetical protein
VSTVRIILVAGAALVAVGTVSPIYGPAAHAQDTKQTPDIRMLLTQPQNRVSSDAAAPPSLRDLPQPKMDKPPVEPPITIVVGDPRCYPGEDGLQSFGQANRRRRH